MSNYKLVTIDQTFIAEAIAKTGSEQLLEKASRNYVGLYDEKENWYIPLRANLGGKKPNDSYFETKFETNNPHFKRPGLDFQKALFVPRNKVIDINNTLPKQQAEIIHNNQDKIQEKFESYVLSVEKLDVNSQSYKYSTVALFPEGIERIKQLQKERLTSNKTTINNSLLDKNISLMERLKQAKNESNKINSSLSKEQDLTIKNDRER